MNRLRTLLLIGLFAPSALGAQRLAPDGATRPRPAELPSLAAPRPPTRLVGRLHRYMNWGTLGGAAAGSLVAVASVPAADDKSASVLLHAVTGAAVGNLVGLVVGLKEPHATDTLPKPLSNDVLRSPFPIMAATLDNVSGYVGMGGRIGASVGFLGALVFAQDLRALAVPMGGLTGWVAGMAVGGVYALSR